VVELDRRIDDPIHLFVNGLRFASGELLVTADDEWAMRIDSLAESA
jgi:flagellar motor switch/type III secretory pathway protein FliN